MSGYLNHHYLVGVGSNVRHAIYGRPCHVLQSAVRVFAEQGLEIICCSPIMASRPLGPSRRTYANGVVMVGSNLGPEALLALLKKTESDFGRRGGRRWGARVLDCDIILWSGGIWSSRHLAIPHPQFRNRDFVLGPALSVAPDWRDPQTGRSLRQLYARLRHKNRRKAACGSTHA